MKTNSIAAVTFLNDLPFGVMLQVMHRAIEGRTDASPIALHSFSNQNAQHADKIWREQAARGASTAVPLTHHGTPRAAQGSDFGIGK